MDDFQSIQELVKKPLKEIPAKYILDEEAAIPTLPHGNSAFSEIPILDMKSFTNEETKPVELQKLHCTCKDWGLFQLVNHGVESLLVEKVKKEMQDFYKLPVEERLRYKIQEGDVEGYGQTVVHSANQRIDWADRFYVITNPTNRRKPHLFPKLPKSLRETLEAYMGELQKVARAMFGLIAEALKIEKGELEDMFENGMQSIRMNYYPPCPEPNRVIGLTPHSDASGITILLQVNGVEGFQFKKDGVWMPAVNILPHALVVNLGDTIEILSNGLYKSVEHRAIVNSQKERISIAMFFNSKFEAEIGPSPSLRGQPPLFRRVSMEQYVNDFFSRKLNGKSFIQYMKI